MAAGSAYLRATIVGKRDGKNVGKQTPPDMRRKGRRVAEGKLTPSARQGATAFCGMLLNVKALGSHHTVEETPAPQVNLESNNYGSKN